MLNTRLTPFYKAHIKKKNSIFFIHLVQIDKLKDKLK